MSDAASSPPRSRLRVWLWLGGVFLALVLVILVVGWLWLRDTRDIDDVSAEAKEAGVAVEVEEIKPTDPVRVARAMDVDASARAIKIESPGLYFHGDGQEVSSEFRAVHFGISSQAVCDVAQRIIDLGSEPIVVPPKARRLLPHIWGRLLNNRMLIAEEVELDLCLAAHRTRIEMLLRQDPPPLLGWWEFRELCGLLPHRLTDRREQLRPIADWLDAKAEEFVARFPELARRVLIQDLKDLQHSEQALKERMVTLSGWMLHGEIFRVIAMRNERAGILRAELDWHRFLIAHAGEPRLWMDEADRRTAAVATIGSWLGTATHQQLLGVQSPGFLRRLMDNVLYARLLSAEVRGAPWPVDLCDRGGAPLRRWEQSGRSIGAYSVGPDGVDDGGDRRKDILFRLRLDPSPRPPAP